MFDEPQKHILPVKHSGMQYSIIEIGDMNINGM